MLITNQKDLDSFCESLKDKEFITIDTEFLREKTYYPKLCLIQICCPDIKEAAAIDTIDGNLDLTPVFDLLADPKILKIFHAARQDLEIFYNLTGKVVHPFFDTQIAAMVCGYGDSVGYESLVRNITGNQLDKSVQYTDWSKRPLSKRQLDYAMGDVTYLVEVYQKLSEELEKRGRTNWVFEEEEGLSDPAVYENAPDKAWERIKIRSPKPKTLAILRALAAWRETRAQDKDIPRAWVMRDDTLADMAAQAPKDGKGLSKIRNVHKDIANNHIGETLIGLIKKAESSDQSTWPKVQKKRGMPSEASAKIDILKMLLKVQAAENEVAAKLIASKDDIEALALQSNPDIPAMKGWRYEIFGKDAMEIKKGQLAIGLKGANITKYKVSQKTEEYD